MIFFYFNSLFELQANKGWALFAYLFGTAEHANYHHVQLLYDNTDDGYNLKIRGCFFKQVGEQVHLRAFQGHQVGFHPPVYLLVGTRFTQLWRKQGHSFFAELAPHPFHRSVRVQTPSTAASSPAGRRPVCSSLFKRV